jgi:hypothetical protein
MQEVATEALDCCIGCLERHPIAGAFGASEFNPDYDGK